MSAKIPDEYRDLLDGPIHVSLATIMPDGQPQLSVVWCNTDGDTVLVNTAVNRQKDKNLRARPIATIMSVDPTNATRYIEVRGTVTHVAGDAVAHINELAKLYTGMENYYGDLAPAELAETETRIMYRITPTRVLAFG